MNYIKTPLILALLFLPLLLKSQFKESLYWEAGIGYSLSVSDIEQFDFLQVPVFGKLVFETQHTESFLTGKFNIHDFGKRYTNDYSPFQNANLLNTSEEFSTFKNLVTVELGMLGRLRFSEKNRWVGLGIEGNYSRNIKRNYKIRPYWISQKPSPFNLGFSFKWQERWRNLVHGFSFHYVLDNNKESFYPGTFAVPNYMTYGIGYRMPFKKIEGEDHELKIWKSILHDSTYNQINLTLGLSFFMPVNFNASAASIHGTGEFFVRINPKNSIGLSGSSWGMETGDDKKMREQYPGVRYLESLSSQVLNFQLFTDHRFKLNEISLFAGIGIGVIHRSAIDASFGAYNREYANLQVLPSKTNFGTSLRTGYKIGRFKHIFSFTLAGKYIPDYFSSTVGWNFGFFKKS